MTIARACRSPAQAFCRRLAGRWWIAQHPPRLRCRRSSAGSAGILIAAVGHGHRSMQGHPGGHGVFIEDDTVGVVVGNLAGPVPRRARAQVSHRSRHLVEHEREVLAPHRWPRGFAGAVLSQGLASDGADECGVAGVVDRDGVADAELDLRLNAMGQRRRCRPPCGGGRGVRYG